MTAPDGPDLPGFLLARIADDEKKAERCVRRNDFGDIISWHPYRHQATDADLPRGSVAVPAPGFLAECDAKRRIVEAELLREVGPVSYYIDPEVHANIRRRTVTPVLRLLALPYADHPDYREEWKP